jgi:hypothetical protein
MTSFELFERTKAYCFNPSKIGKTLRKYQTLQKQNTTYLYLNRCFRLAIIVKVAPGFQNQTSEKMALQHKEGLEW